MHPVWPAARQGSTDSTRTGLVRSPYNWGSAARILGAADVATERTGAMVVDKSVQDVREHVEREVRARLGPDRWATGYVAGGKASIDSLLKDIDGIV